MILNDGVSDRMLKIRSIHEDAQLRANSELNDDALKVYLETTDVQFRSIAYEAASMSRGLLDISKGNNLDSWSTFLQNSEAYSVQIYIGLGWALSQRQVPLPSFFMFITPLMQARVLDGYGYYEGMFRNRTSIRDKVLPKDISGNNLRAYDQGVGRSLWYFSKGNITSLERLINSFPDNRKPDIWRGIGIAVSYVGADENLYRSIYELAAKYHIQLASGAVFLAHSRFKANNLNIDTELACRIWCKMSALEAVAILQNNAPAEPTSGHSYIEWVQRIEQSLEYA